MKILQLINNLGSGGAEKLIADFVPLMRAKGHTVEVLLLKCQGSLYIGQLQDAGIKVVCLSESSLYSLKHIWRIRQYIRKGGFDVVHVHIFPALYFAAMAAFIGIGGAKLCFTEHSTTNTRMKYGFFTIFDRLIYSVYHSIICITEEVKTNIETHLHNKKIHFTTVFNGINLRKFNLPLQLSRCDLVPPSAQKVVTMVGRFTDAKDQATLINSLLQLPPTTHLLLVGEGPLKASLETLVAELDLTQRVHFLGLRKDVPDILRLSDIGVLSSNWEGFGLAAVEVMAAGIPVVVSNVDGLSQVVGEAGLLFEKGNATELAQHINRLITDPTYYHARATACKQQAQRYSIDKMVEGYLEVYRTMIN